MYLQRAKKKKNQTKRKPFLIAGNTIVKMFDEQRALSSPNSFSTAHRSSGNRCDERLTNLNPADGRQPIGRDVGKSTLAVITALNQKRILYVERLPVQITLSTLLPRRRAPLYPTNRIRGGLLWRNCVTRRHSAGKRIVQFTVRNISVDCF